MNTLNQLKKEVEALAKEYGIEPDDIVIEDEANFWTFTSLLDENFEDLDDVETWEQFCDEAKVGQVLRENGKIQVFLNESTDGMEFCDLVEPHGGAYIYYDVSGNYLVYADQLAEGESPEQWYVDNLGMPDPEMTAEEVFRSAKESKDPETILGYHFFKTTKEVIDFSAEYGIN